MSGPSPADLAREAYVNMHKEGSMKTKITLVFDQDMRKLYPDPLDLAKDIAEEFGSLEVLLEGVFSAKVEYVEDEA